MSHVAKLALLAAFILRPMHWDAQAEAWSRLLPHDWPGEHTGSLGRKVKAGEYFALEMLDTDGHRLGVLVYAVDRSFPQPEFIVKAAYSDVGAIDVTAICLPKIEAHARFLGCATVRFNTMRPGLISKTLAAGFRVSEVVMRKDVRAHRVAPEPALIDRQTSPKNV